MAQTIKLKRSATQNSIPTTSALALGEVAINTYDGKMYIKKSVGGTESVVEVGGQGGGIASSFTVYEYTATANQTTFSGSDGNSNTLAYDTATPPKILVYLNGVLLDFTTDYTASNGTSVVFTNGAGANDLVQIAAYKSSVSTSLDISLSDSQKLLLGNDDDLEIFHDGSHSRIKDTGTGNLILNTQAFRVNGADDSEGMIKATQDGNVELYYNGLKKIETTTYGATVTSTHGNVTIGAQNTSGLHIYTDRPRFYLNKRLSLIENILTSYDNNLQLQTQGVTKLTLNSAGINVTGSVTASGGSVLARPVLVNGAHDNSGNANFAVDGGAYLSFYDNQVQIGNSGINWNLKISHDMSSTANMQAWNSNIVIGSNATNTGSATARDIIFSPQISGTAVSTERMRIKGDGNVGIGTANPGRKLTVQGATGDNLPARFIGGANTTHGSIEFQDPNTTADYKVTLGSKGDDLYFQAGGNEKVRVKSTGNVGIGTITPQSKLDVKLGNNETASIGGTISVGTYAGLRFGYSETGNTNYRHSAIVFERDDASFGDARGNIHILNSPSGSTSADLGDARLTILPSGNIGIGTTSPDYKLDVEGSGNGLIVSRVRNTTAGTTARADMLVESDASDIRMIATSSQYTGVAGWADTGIISTSSGTSGGMLFNVQGNYPYRFMQNATTERMRIHTNGNVGIGTTSPADKLHISGGNILLNNAIEIRTKDTGGTIRTIMRVNNSNQLEYGWSGAGPVKFMGGGSYTERMRIHTNGNVGIGNTAPGYKLDVKTSATGIIARIEGETGRYIYTGTDGSGHYIEQVGTSTANRRLRVQASNGSGTYTQLNIEGGNRRIWTNSGTNVGIGTSSPQTNMALDVRANGNTAGSTGIAAYGYNATGRAILANGYATSGTGTNRGIEGISTGGRSSVSGSINVGGHFYAQGAETNYALTTGAGNVGIGTTAPQAKLQVEALGIDTTTTNTSATTQVAIDTFAAATFRSARYTIQVTNSTDNTYHLTEVLLIHDGTTPQITEYATIFTGSAEAIFDADISSGNVRLLATPASTDSMAFKVVRYSILV